MSRSGYTYYFDEPFAHGRWRSAVRRALEGKRGQALLAELAQALDEMPDKRLYSGSFATADGEFCTLGVLGSRRGTKMDDLGDADYCETELVGQRFGIAPAMAAEIMYLNDEYFVDEWQWVEVDLCGPVRPHWPDWGKQTRLVQVHNDNHAVERWQKVRQWVAEHLAASPKAEKEGEA